MLPPEFPFNSPESKSGLPENTGDPQDSCWIAPVLRNALAGILQKTNRLLDHQGPVPPVLFVDMIPGLHQKNLLLQAFQTIAKHHNVSLVSAGEPDAFAPEWFRNFPEIACPIEESSEPEQENTSGQILVVWDPNERFWKDAALIKPRPELILCLTSGKGLFPEPDWNAPTAAVRLSTGQLAASRLVRQPVYVNTPYTPGFSLEDRSLSEAERMILAALKKRRDLERLYIIEGIRQKPELLIVGETQELLDMADNVVRSERIGRYKKTLPGMLFPSREEEPSVWILHSSGISSLPEETSCAVLVYLCGKKGATLSSGILKHLLGVPRSVAGPMPSPEALAGHVYTDAVIVGVEEDVLPVLSLRRIFLKKGTENIKLLSRGDPGLAEEISIRQEKARACLLDTLRERLGACLRLSPQENLWILSGEKEGMNPGETGEKPLKTLEKRMGECLHDSFPEQVADVMVIWRQSMGLLLKKSASDPVLAQKAWELFLFQPEKYKEILRESLYQYQQWFGDTSGFSTPAPRERVFSLPLFQNQPDIRNPECPLGYVSTERSPYSLCFLPKNRPEEEKQLEKFLEKNRSRIQWWVRNASLETQRFGLVHWHLGAWDAFYPSHLILFADGAIGIFDLVISGKDPDWHLLSARARALQEYTREYSRTDKHLTGGLLFFDQTGEPWVYNPRENSWETFEI